uniref:PH domain-containing protein n=1 Tax=Hucho hucho TaxID=62062 RepID=A0A4W5RFV9_9TELE
RVSPVVNEEGQPLIEGKLKEKQVRWKFIKRWKTRYFTLAGNQLLFRKGKSKDELDDSTIELSKVQSVKVGEFQVHSCNNNSIHTLCPLLITLSLVCVCVCPGGS